ncbi:universal stress protein [Peribacillus sp. SCS-26]|uniref:universal stress protein n=1 Tax=Paraperibacillus marinus TaxID=3115295 RepID=UPI003905E967
MALAYKRILAAVDGSKEAEWSLKKAIEIALRNQSQIVIAHVLDNRTAASGETFGSQAGDGAGWVNDMMEKYKAQALESGVLSVITAVEYGSPKVKIPKEIAKEFDIDLIICGATGHNLVERFFMGSVSEHITRHAACDVLVVRTPDEMKKQEAGSY